MDSGNLDSLVSAALEGVKVPGLVAEVERLKRELEKEADDSLLVIAEMKRLGEERVSALQAQVATLTVERDRLRHERDCSQGCVAALERDLTNRGIELKNAQAERDALRAQVVELRDWIRDASTTHGIGFPCSLMDDALSAPPAETCSAHPGKRCDPETPGVFECRVHESKGRLLSATPIIPSAETEHTFCGDPDCEGRHAETTPATEREEWSTAEAPSCWENLGLNPDDECEACEAPRYAHHPGGTAGDCQGIFVIK